MLSTRCTAYFAGRDGHNDLISWTGCLRLLSYFCFSFSFSFIYAQTFLIRSASDACDGQFKTVIPRSRFHWVQRRLPCFGSLSSWRSTLFIWPKPRLCNWNHIIFINFNNFFTLRISVKIHKRPKPFLEKNCPKSVPLSHVLQSCE